MNPAHLGGTIDSIQLWPDGCLLEQEATLHKWINTQPTSLSWKWWDFCFGQGGLCRNRTVFREQQLQVNNHIRHPQICPKYTYCPQSCLWLRLRDKWQPRLLNVMCTAQDNEKIIFIKTRDAPYCFLALISLAVINTCKYTNSSAGCCYSNQ